MYTDGLVEATNPQNEMFGVGRLRDAAEGQTEDSPEDVIREIRRRLESFVEGEPLEDGTTMLVRQIK